ncbi:MAG: oligosaccharide flippase family protein [Lachnospiraceae bacterium]|nr:oligosaccharide flippase family protein [Lachnospiraceae bacterium]
MLKTLLKNSLLRATGIYTITSIINSAIPFLLLPILTRYLTPEDYGIVSMFTLLITFVSPFTGLSINGAISRQYYNKDEVDIWKYVFNCFLILITSTLFVSIIFFIFSKMISDLASFPSSYLWLVIVYSFSQFVVSIVLSLWQVQKKALRYGIFVNGQTLLNGVLSIAFVVSLNFGWKGRIYGQTIAVLVFAGFAIITLFKNKWITFSFNKKYILNALNFGVPLIPHALSGSIISMTDRVFITGMVGLAATGVYTVGYQVGSIINILAMSFNNAYIPWLYERLEKNDNTTKIKIVKFTYLYFVLIIFLAIVLGMIAPYALKIFLGESFNNSSIYVIWIALGYAFNGMYLMVVNYIFYAQKTKYLAMVTFFTAILNIILNYYFIKANGAIGAAQATTIIFLIKFLIVWILSDKVQRMPWNLIRQKIV